MPIAQALIACLCDVDFSEFSDIVQNSPVDFIQGFRDSFPDYINGIAVYILAPMLNIVLKSDANLRKPDLLLLKDRSGQCGGLHGVAHPLCTFVGTTHKVEIVERVHECAVSRVAVVVNVLRRYEWRKPARTGDLDPIVKHAHEYRHVPQTIRPMCASVHDRFVPGFARVFWRRFKTLILT